jgi:DNA-binding LacI/PurR family transcriptional regulator
MWDEALRRRAARMSDPQPNEIPVYQQVANILRTQIVGMEGDRPARLPNEEQLATTHGVARGTIREALQVLAEEGLIERARGRGTVTMPAGIHAWRRLRKSRVIKVISSWQIQPDVPGEFYGQIYQGILVAAQHAGYRVSLSRMGGHFPRIQANVSPEDPEQTIGVILVGLSDERIIEMHTQAGYPVVCTDYWPSHRQADGVVFDCFGEGITATEFLLAQGHRRLFYVGNCQVDEDGRLRHECDADLMEAGCRRALQEAGLTLPAKHVRYCKHDDVKEAVKWFRSLRLRPTAGVIFSFSTLENFARALARRGLTCPEDVSLICKASVGAATSATCMRNDSFLIGQHAVDLLLERAAGRRTAGVRLAISSILHRGSSVRGI